MRLNHSSLFFFIEIQQIRDKRRVEKIQEDCLNALFSYTQVNHQTPVKYSHLLLLVGELQKFNSKMIEDLFFKDFLGNHTIDNLLYDILRSF